MAVTVCNDGTLATNSSSITFTNINATDCTITSCTLPGWPTTNPVVPANGSVTVQLAVAAVTGDYEYVGSCCGKRNNPVIKVQ